MFAHNRTMVVLVLLVLIGRSDWRPMLGVLALRCAVSRICAESCAVGHMVVRISVHQLAVFHTEAMRDESEVPNLADPRHHHSQRRQQETPLWAAGHSDGRTGWHECFYVVRYFLRNCK